jgi:hypothetical protein
MELGGNGVGGNGEEMDQDVLPPLAGERERAPH